MTRIKDLINGMICRLYWWSEQNNDIDSAQHGVSCFVSLPVGAIVMFILCLIIAKYGVDSLNVSILGFVLHFKATYLLINFPLFVVCVQLFYRYYFKSGRYHLFDSSYYRERYSSPLYFLFAILYLYVPYGLSVLPLFFDS